MIDLARMGLLCVLGAGMAAAQSVASMAGARPGDAARDSRASPVTRPSAVGDAPADRSHAGRIGLIALAAVAAATGNQVIGSPEGWQRTAGGYASRLGDQAGFALVEEVVRIGWQRSAGWSSDATPCT